MVTAAFTVDPSSLTVENYVHVLSGRRDPSIVAMTVNGVSGLVSFPTPTTWKTELVLAAGINLVKIRAQDNALVWTPEMTVSLTLPAYELGAHAKFNELDEHGLEVGLDRNPGEKNWDYRTRLLEYASYETGPNVEGTFLGVAAELGIKPTLEALQLRVRRLASGELGASEVYFEITPTAFFVDAMDLVKTREVHRVDPRTRSIVLDEYWSWPDEVKVYNSNDDRVQPHRYSLDEYNKTVTFADDDLNGEWVTVHYNYRYRIEHLGLTLGQLKSRLEAITVGGQMVLEVSVSDESLSALGLTCRGRELLDHEWTSVAHARLRVIPLENRKYQDSLLNGFGTAFGTKLERWAKASRSRSSMGWDELTLDEGLWDVDADKGAIDFLPRLFDAVFGRWYCTHPQCSLTYDRLGYRKNGGVCPAHGTPLEYQGITLDMIQSGIVESDSLYAIAEAVEEEL